MATGFQTYLSPRRAAAILLVAVLSWVALEGWERWQRLRAWQSPPTLHPVQPPAAQRVDGQSIAQVHLFGEPKAENPQETIPEDLPETRLRLTLRGVADGSDGSEEGALIDGPDGRTEFYRLGETVAGGAILKDVREDSIVLDRNGKLEVLRFPEVSDASEWFEVANPEPEPFEAGDDVPPVYDGEMSGLSPEESPPVDDADLNATQEQVLSQSPPSYSAPVIDEARREEIRTKLQQLREQIRAQSQQ